MTTSKTPATGRRFRGLDGQQRQRQRREQLIEAGLHAFGSKGYHSAGVREICGEAKLTERYFYESFANREALFLAVYEHAIETVRAAVVQALGRSDRDVRSLARSAIRSFLETLRDDPRLSRILLIDALTVSADVGRQSQLATQSFADLVGSVIVSLYPQLPKQDLDIQLIANGLVGSTVYLVMHWAFKGFDEPLEKMLAHCVLFYDAAIAQAEQLTAAS
ncbi:TetR/AcrR family transcriptional regulator [Solimonas terrae]|uniref:TetR/AcrR family transcriptional regulator n=1 Tax=Solimonas terrae TaxID=1396819 RepID=A0A6M2BV13_9GAMM|nr:TetR/AcrR family transcriptional regulator [Solimonas terrae]NGY06234.1 TetR/AcrR family transcriptional regulator [Solimonas terrae]